MLRHSNHTRNSAISSPLCVAAFVSLALFGGCAQLELTLPSLPELSDDPVVAEADFPELEQPRDRPQLGYDLEQVRDIEQGLASDRANARYSGDAVRYETGQLSEPPPLPSRVTTDPAQLRPLPATAGPGDLIAQNSAEIDAAEAALEERLAAQTNEIETDGSTLDDFLDNLGQGRTEFEATPQPEAISIVNAAPEPEPVAQTAVVAGSITQPLTIEFAPRATVLPNSQLAAITELAIDLTANGLGVRILAGGVDQGLAIDRAREVAVRLVARGVPGNLIDVETGGVEGQVVIYPVGQSN